eukprot:XP_001707781.1 Hypothetical protein GL50803_19023 [Giardia lamblia ATCC 50803]
MLSLHGCKEVLKFIEELRAFHDVVDVGLRRLRGFVLDVIDIVVLHKRGLEHRLGPLHHALLLPGAVVVHHCPITLQELDGRIAIDAVLPADLRVRSAVNLSHGHHREFPRHLLPGRSQLLAVSTPRSVELYKEVLVLLKLALEVVLRENQDLCAHRAKERKCTEKSKNHVEKN